MVPAIGHQRLTSSCGSRYAGQDSCGVRGDNLSRQLERGWVEPVEMLGQSGVRSMLPPRGGPRLPLLGHGGSGFDWQVAGVLVCPEQQER
jgi:hypothetical protein